MKRHAPALLGGLFIGVLSSLPVVSLCCCLWAVCGGLLTVYLQQQSMPEPIETADAALGGLFAGLIGAVIAWIVPIVLVTMGGTSFQELFREALQESDRIPPEWRDRFMNFLTGRNIPFLMLVVNVPVYAVFTLLGSLLGVAFFRKKVPPQAQG